MSATGLRRFVELLIDEFDDVLGPVVDSGTHFPRFDIDRGQRLDGAR